MPNGRIHKAATEAIERRRKLPKAGIFADLPMAPMPGAGAIPTPGPAGMAPPLLPDGWMEGAPERPEVFPAGPVLPEGWMEGPPTVKPSPEEPTGPVLPIATAATVSPGRPERMRTQPLPEVPWNRLIDSYTKGVEAGAREATAFPPMFPAAAPIIPQISQEKKMEHLRELGRVPKETLRRLIHGSIGLVESTAGTGVEYIGGKIGLPTIERFGREAAEFYQGAAKPYEPPRDLQGTIVDNPGLMAKVSWWLPEIAEMLPSFIVSMLPAVGVAKRIRILGKAIPFTKKTVERLARLGGAIAGGTVGGELEGAQTYREIISKGGTPEDARAGMEQMGLASAGLNALSLGFITKRMPPKLRGKIIKYIASGIWEGGTEYAEEPTEAAIKYRLGFATPEEVKEQIKAGLNVVPIAALMGGGGAYVAGKAGAAEELAAQEAVTPVAEPRERIEETADQLGWEIVIESNEEWDRKEVGVSEIYREDVEIQLEKRRIVRRRDIRKPRRFRDSLGKALGYELDQRYSVIEQMEEPEDDLVREVADAGSEHGYVLPDAEIQEWRESLKRTARKRKGVMSVQRVIGKWLSAPEDFASRYPHLANLFGRLMPEEARREVEAKPEPAVPAEEVPPTLDELRGSLVRRIEEPGVERATVEKPHGIYTTPANLESPHAFLGGSEFFWRVNPDANILVVPDIPGDSIRTGRRGLAGKSAGIKALEGFVGEAELGRLSELAKPDLIEELSKTKRKVDWSRYYDEHEILEAYGGLLAREKGYDAIYQPAEADPNETEFVGLTEKAMSPVEEVPAKPAEGVIEPEVIPVKEPWEMTRQNFYQNVVKPNIVKTDYGSEPSAIYSEYIERYLKIPIRDQTARIIHSYRVAAQQSPLPSVPGLETIARQLKAGARTIEDIVHRAATEQALREGKPVPAEVLKDYPDLAKEAKPAEKPAKEAWEMTQAEWFASRPLTIAIRGPKGEIYKGEPGEIHATLLDRLPYHVQRILHETITRPSEGVEAKEREAERRAMGADVGWVDKGGNWIYSSQLEEIRSRNISKHRTSIERALREGKPVSAEVLKDYPELAKALPEAVTEKPAKVVPITRGEQRRIYLPDNSSIDASFAIVEAEDLIASHDQDYRVNPSYPTELQPRDRDRFALKQQVEMIANNPNPERLADSPSASPGAPVIGPDMIVESGNGRIVGLRKAYAQGTGEAYKTWVLDHASDFGLSREDVEILRNPILVRVRSTPVERNAFAKLANVGETARMSPVEQSRSDADLINDALLEVFRPTEEGNLVTRENAQFMHGFLDLLGPTESAGLVTSEGGYTRQLIDRVRNALFWKAYQVEDLLPLVAETDSNIQNILNALMVSAPSYVKLRRVAGKTEADLIISHITAAATLVKQARDSGNKVVDVLNQGMLFGDIPENTAAIAKIYDDYKRSTRNLSHVLRGIATEMIDRRTRGMTTSMFDMGPERTPIQLIQDALGRMEAEHVTKIQKPGLFEFAEEAKERGGPIAPREEAPRAEVTAEEPPPVVEEPLKPEAEVIAERADMEREALETAPGVVAPSMRQRWLKETGREPSVKAPSDVIEGRLEAAHGVKRETSIERVKSVAADLWHKVTRPQEHLPVTGKYAYANEFFRLLKALPEAVRDEASRRVAAITYPLGKEEKQLFERYLIARNLQESVKRGEPLRFGFRDQRQVDDYVEELEVLLNENESVRRAVDSRQKVIDELLKELQEYGIVGKDVDREWYYHQQVLSHLQLQRVTSLATARRKKRAFQKRRVVGPEEMEAEADYNTDYIEAEVTWMTEALAELEKEKRLRDLNDRYGVEEEKEGYSVWQPQPGNYFYQASTIPEKLVEQLQKGIVEQIELSTKDIRTVLAMGGSRRQFILPDPIIRQLENMDKQKPTGALASLAKDGMRSWKIWTLLNPKRALAYMLRNITGDIDPVIAGAAGVRNEVPRAVRELYKFHKSYLALSPELREARDLGVIRSGITAQEIPDLEDVEIFKRFYDSKRKPTSLPAKYFDKVKRFNQFREDTLRYAAYLYYKKKLASGQLKHYGGAKKEVIDTLAAEMGTNEAAAHLARKMLGDYGDLSVMGNWLRANAIPFWSWQEVNVRRYPRLAINAIKSGTGRGKLSALLSAAAVLRIGTLYATLYAWNHLFFGDDEDELAHYEKANPHILLGRNPDGSINILRNTGALGDLIEWVGLNEIISLWPQVKAGQITYDDLAKEMAKAPFEKVFWGMRPDIKALFEISAGRTLFPDVFNPRPKERGEIAAGILGLQDEYNAARGILLREGSRARPNYFQRFIGVTDPRRNALNEIYTLRERFLKSEGKERPAVWGISPFRKLRYAAMNNDKESFDEALFVYLQEGKTGRNFAASLRFLDPVEARLSEDLERKFEHEFLTVDQQKTLRFAREYAGELRGRLLSWWMQAMREGRAPPLSEAKRKKLPALRGLRGLPGL